MLFQLSYPPRTLERSVLKHFVGCHRPASIWLPATEKRFVIFGRACQRLFAKNPIFLSSAPGRYLSDQSKRRPFLVSQPSASP